MGGFRTEWDEPYELADTLNLDPDSEDDLMYLEEVLPRTNMDGFGVVIDINVSAESFSSLMKEVDQREDLLLKQDSKTWELVEQAVTELQGSKHAKR